jgi:TRAP-type C4-dicarboxylate transport system permease small subunit
MDMSGFRPAVFHLKRFDRAWARCEGGLTVLVLILMVLVAGFQAFVRNLTRWDIEWAAALLYDMEWADSFLRKGTLWLAFLGASLATHYGRHIGIDILARIAPPRPRFLMRGLSNLLAGIITVGLVVCFSSAVRLNLTERPLEYEVYAEQESMHVCDAPDDLLKEIELQRPALFCWFRSLLAALAVPAETPGAAFQIIVPVMFLAVAIRLVARGIGAFLVLAGGDNAISAALAEQAREAAERARSAATSESLRPPAVAAGSTDAEQPPLTIERDPDG